MIAIIDYGAGNLLSVKNALDKLGLSSAIVKDPVELLKADRAILPGVGAFASCMRHLERSALIPAIKTYISSRRPFLGICVGLQLLLDESQEKFGAQSNPAGLGLIHGTVKRFSVGLKVPQIGWNLVQATQASPLFRGLPETGFYCYFVHSYYVELQDEAELLCHTEYGVDYCSGIQRGNLFGLQFHPEKSGRVGLAILKNFGEM